jgi:Mce-associated membrane protein
VTDTVPQAPSRLPLPPAARTAAVLLAVLATLLLAASAGLAVTVKSHLDDRNALDDAREGALAAARQEVINLDSVSWSTFDRDFARILSGGTGDFKDQITKGQAELKRQVLARKTVLSGKVLSAGVVRADTSTATVLIGSEETVKDSTTTQGGTVHARWRVDLEKHGGRWLVSNLQAVS